jgi:hypothetical protein
MTVQLTRKDQDQPVTITGPLVAAIETTWAAIRHRHSDVPHVVLTLGGGTNRPGQVTLGHFHDGKWATANESRLPELFIGGEGLQLGPVPLLGTLLHEAAHGIASTRGVKDTSRQGRYHNTRYRDLAHELGITVERDPSIGWSITSVPDATAAGYALELTGLAAALSAYRLADHHAPGRTGSNNGLVAECGCEPARKIRISRSTFDQGPIDCGLCGEAFSARDT